MTGPVPRPSGEVIAVPVGDGVVVAEVVGTGPPLLLIHGWTLDRRIWDLQRPLARHFRIVAVDRRGFGQSTAPPDLGREPADIIAVADALGLDRFALGGLSQGGRVAMRTALLAPRRVTHVVLLGSALDGLGSDDAEPPIPIAAMRSAACAGDLDGLRACWRRHPFMAARTVRGRRLLDGILSDYDGRELLSGAGCLPVMAGDLAALGMPVCALVGVHDTPHRHQVAAAIAQFSPRGSLIKIPRAGHLCNLDNPRDVAHCFRVLV
ncbi:MAG: alpha/beta hydrolase [Sandarakinorhabdus sp.]|nr:alpha/beta hydrolase [Sandarakinorhabdus sp.]